MRIDSTTRLWPAAVAAVSCFSRIAAAGLDDPGQIQHESVINFVDASFITDAGSEAAVYSVADQESLSKTFYWTTTQFASVTDAWLIRGADYIVHQSPGKSGLPPTTTGTASNDVVAAGGSKRQTSPVQLLVSANNTGGSITISNLLAIGTDPGFGEELHFKVAWNQSGASYSRSFTVTDIDADSPSFKALQEKFNSDDSYLPEDNPSATASQTATASVSSATTAVGLTKTATAPASTDSTGTTAPISSNTKKGGGGLSTGAIAGIAVACGVIGLALIGAAVWFFCFRRRGRGDGVSAAPYGSDRHHRTQELIAEKEANAGANESSPHSPYSDDGLQHHQQPAGLNGSIPLQQQQQPPSGRDSAHFVGAAAPIMAPSPHPHSIGDRSYTPYSDHRGSGIVGTPETQQSQPVHYEQQPPQQPQSERGAPSPQPASQPAAAAARSVSPQQPVTGRYAHLVEEGMTEDEIRRLEEEERQLDAAIADREAGRGR